mgnify:CR=1 FL=1
MTRKRAASKKAAAPAAETPDFADIAAAVRALAEAHAPTRVQLQHENEEAARAASATAPPPETLKALADPAVVEVAAIIDDGPIDAEALRAAEAAAAEAAAEPARHKRMIEALLFAAEAPLSTEALRQRMPEGVDVSVLLAQLQDDYAERGRLAGAAVSMKNYARFLDEQIDLNKEFASAANSFTTLASSLSRS